MTERAYDFRMTYREIENLCSIFDEIALEHTLSPLSQDIGERLEQLRGVAYQLEPIDLGLKTVSHWNDDEALPHTY